MIEVIGKDETQYKRVTCGNCANVLRYVNADVRQDYSSDYTGSRDYYSYIRCPCGKQVVVRGY